MSRPATAPLVYDVLRLPDGYTSGRVEWLCACGGAPCARYAPYAELSNPAWVVYVAAPWRTCPTGEPRAGAR